MFVIDLVVVFLTQTQNISTQPPLRRGGVKKIKPLFEEGFGEMFATVGIYHSLKKKAQLERCSQRFSYSNAKHLYPTFLNFSLTRKISPPNLLFEEEEHTTMKAPLGRGVWGDVSNSWNLSNLRRKGKHIWGDVRSDFLTRTQKHLHPASSSKRRSKKY
ncbi:hypothetical protein [Dokdonia sp. Asnod1-B02]|uniref:hypothetical protein n=1 Tax=Dokdonia sp. Asnod1-B02 TaxID=3160573 RepID=UPI0038634D0F